MEDSEVHLPVAAITPYLCFSVLDFASQFFGTWVLKYCVSLDKNGQITKLSNSSSRCFESVCLCFLQPINKPEGFEICLPESTFSVQLLFPQSVRFFVPLIYNKKQLQYSYNHIISYLIYMKKLGFS